MMGFFSRLPIMTSPLSSGEAFLSLNYKPMIHGLLFGIKTHGIPVPSWKSIISNMHTGFFMGKYHFGYAFPNLLVTLAYQP